MRKATTADQLMDALPTGEQQKLPVGTPADDAIEVTKNAQEEEER